MAWIAPLLKMLEGIQDMMSALTFIQFIEEEAIQSAALGCFMALRHGSYKGLSWGYGQMETCIEHLEVVNSSLGWAAPYSQGCFYDFIQASRTNLNIYQDILLIKVKGFKQ
jgi:hypothetical protein